MDWKKAKYPYSYNIYQKEFMDNIALPDHTNFYYRNSITNQIYLIGSPYEKDITHYKYLEEFCDFANVRYIVLRRRIFFLSRTYNNYDCFF